jgi:sec-independent protein translocase protein TatC
VIVGAFVVAAVLTPPDVISQFMLAIPLVLLYELGIILGGFLKTHSRNPEADADDDARDAAVAKAAESADPAPSNRP